MKPEFRKFVAEQLRQKLDADPFFLPWDNLTIEMTPEEITEAIHQIVDEIEHGRE